MSDVKEALKIQTLGGVTPSAGSVAGGSHSSLSDLASDTHSQYVHNTIARTISAQHTFNPGSAGAPFLLGVNASGQLVTGLNADLLDGLNSSAFVQTTRQVIAGDGLTGGGALSSDVTLNVVGGTLITANANDVQLANGSAQYQVPVTGATPFTPAYQTITSLTGDALEFNGGASGRLSVRLAALSGLVMAGSSPTKTLGVGAGAGITVNAGDVALTTPGSLSVATANAAAGNHTHAVTTSSNPGAAAAILATDASGFLTLVRLGIGTMPSYPLQVRNTTEQMRLEYDASNYTSFTVGSGGNLTVAPTGDLILDPVGNDVLPNLNYDINLGAITKKYLTLHAAELWVETLVAQDTIATIGGRIMVLPTTTLIADLNPGAGGSAPTYVNHTTAVTSGATTTIAPNVPSGLADQDVMIAQVAWGNNSSITPPGGWTLILDTAQSTNMHSALYYRVVATAGSEPASYTWTIGTSVQIAASITAYRGVDNASPIDNAGAAAGGQGNSSSTSCTAPTITTVTDNCVLLFYGSGAGAQTWTAPGTMTERYDIQTTGGTNRTATSDYETFATAGATGTRVATLSSATGNVGQLIALKPSSSSSTMDVKHNQMSSGDRVLMQANGKLEWMAVTSAPTAIAGGYRYTVTRDLDGTGANTWYAGDAVANTGQAGQGYIDAYSLHSVTAVPLDYIYNYDNNGASTPFEAGVYSTNYAQSSNFQPFADNAGTGTNDAMYFGVANKTWANIYWNIITAAVWTLTGTWEYWNGSAWTSFSPTTTGSFTATGARNDEWSAASLTGWTAKTINGASAYWVRLRISSFTSVTTLPTQGARRVYYNKSTIGPTIAGMKRNSSTFNDITEQWVIGNLNGYYGYGVDTPGIGLGTYEASKTHVTLDTTNGLRMFSGLSTVTGQWATNGDITVGEVGASKSNVFITSGGVRLRNNTTVKIDLQSDGDLFVGTDTSAAGTTSLAVFSNNQTYNSESVEVGDILIGDNSASKANILWDKSAAQLKFRGGTSTQAYIDTDGRVYAGAGKVFLDTAGISLKSPTSGGQLPNEIKWVDTDLTTPLMEYYFYNDNAIANVRFGGMDMATATGMDVHYSMQVGSAGTRPADFAISAGNGTTTVKLELEAHTIGNGDFAALTGAGLSLGAASADIPEGTLNMTGGLNVGSGAYGLAGNGEVVIRRTDALTNSRNNIIIFDHRSSGTPAANFGTSTVHRLDTSNNTLTTAAEQAVTWATATNGSQKGRVIQYVYDTTFREAFRYEASGSAPMLGFFGSAAIAKPAVTGSRGGNAALASLLTQLANLGLITDSTTA